MKLKWNCFSDKSQFVEQITRAHFYTPFGVVHYARNLALPLGELSVQPTEREKHMDFRGVCTQIDITIQKRL